MTIVGSVPGYALRFVLSGKEYSKLYDNLLVKYDISSKLPAPSAVRAAEAHQDGLSRLAQGQTRLLVKSYVILSLANIALLNRSGRAVQAGKVAAMLSSVSGLYRVIYSALSSSRETFLGTDKVTRKKRKKLAKILTPLISGIAAGSAFSIVSASEARTYFALFVATRAVESVYNYLDDLGYLEIKPRILGSWAMFPFAFSQLFYAFLFHPDCCPDAFKRVMLLLADPFYLAPRPVGFPADQNWPQASEIVSSIAAISSANYPKFVSGIMDPEGKRSLASLGAEFTAVEPIISIANPANSTLTGAVLHPLNPSELQTFAEMAFNSYSSIGKFILPLYGGIAVSRIGFAKSTTSVSSALAQISQAIGNTLRTTTFISMSTASAWAGIGLFQAFFPNRVFPTYRYQLIGFLAGLWAFVDQVSGRARYMYAVRMALLSQWKIWVKQGRVKPIRNGDVALFAISFATIMTIYDLSPESIAGSSLRKALNWIKSHQLKDVVAGKLIEAKHVVAKDKASSAK